MFYTTMHIKNIDDKLCTNEWL